MSKFRINTEVNGEEYICQIDIEADECYAIDNYNVSVNGATLKFYEYTKVMNEKEIIEEEVDKAWNDFNEYAKVKSKENYIKNTVNKIVSELMYKLDKNNSHEAYSDIDEEYLIHIEQMEDENYNNDYESKEFFLVQLVHVQLYGAIEKVTTSGVSINELEETVDYLIKRYIK